MLTSLSLPRPLFPQSAALECSFGQEEVFEVVWVNESAILCDQVVVSGVAPAGPRGAPHKSTCGTASSPSNLTPPSGPLPSSPALICLHGVLSPEQRPNVTYTPHAFPILLQLHTTQKSQVFPLSLQLKGPPARFLDSPDPMTGWSPHPPDTATGDLAPKGWGSALEGRVSRSRAHCVVTAVAPHHP